MRVPCDQGRVYVAGGGDWRGVLLLRLLAAVFSHGSRQNAGHARGVAHAQTDVYVVVRLKNQSVTSYFAIARYKSTRRRRFRTDVF